MDLGSKGKTPRVGARLKALDEAVLMAVSDFSCNFFCILTFRFEQCDFQIFGPNNWANMAFKDPNIAPKGLIFSIF